MDGPKKLCNDKKWDKTDADGEKLSVPGKS